MYRRQPVVNGERAARRAAGDWPATRVQNIVVYFPDAAAVCRSGIRVRRLQRSAAADGGAAGGYRSRQRRHGRPLPAKSRAWRCCHFQATAAPVTPMLPTCSRRQSSFANVRRNCLWTVNCSLTPLSYRRSPRKAPDSPLQGRANVMISRRWRRAILATKSLSVWEAIALLGR